MTRRRDDMTIRVGGERRQAAAPVRARAERRERAAERRRIRLGRIARRLAAQRAARSRRPGGRQTGKGGGLTAGKAIRGAGRAAGRLAIVSEVIIAMGREFRRYSEGKSGRLMDAEDAHVMLRGLDENATAAVRARSMIESNPDLVEMVHFGGMEASGVGRMASDLRKMHEKMASAEDMLNRRPELDSADSLMDKFAQKVLRSQVKAKMREATGKIRWLRGALKEFVR